VRRVGAARERGTSAPPAREVQAILACDTLSASVCRQECVVAEGVGVEYNAALLRGSAKL